MVECCTLEYAGVLEILSRICLDVTGKAAADISFSTNFSTSHSNLEAALLSGVPFSPKTSTIINCTK